jgi:rare lipoprotein A
MLTTPIIFPLLPQPHGDAPRSLSQRLVLLSLLGLGACGVNSLPPSAAGPGLAQTADPTPPPVRQAMASLPPAPSVVLPVDSSSTTIASRAVGEVPRPIVPEPLPGSAQLADEPIRLDRVGTKASDAVNPLVVGLASWYGGRFHGRRTANGERYDMHALTAAHRTLPFGTRLRVRSVTTGREVVVRINDRGPFRYTRIIDLSFGAAQALGVTHLGVTRVELFKE